MLHCSKVAPSTYSGTFRLRWLAQLRVPQVCTGFTAQACQGPQ